MSDRSTELEGLLAAEKQARANDQQTMATQASQITDLQGQLATAKSTISTLQGQPAQPAQTSDTLDATAVGAMQDEESALGVSTLPASGGADSTSATAQGATQN